MRLAVSRRRAYTNISDAINEGLSVLADRPSSIRQEMHALVFFKFRLEINDLVLCCALPVMRAHQRLSSIRKIPRLVRENEGSLNQSAYFTDQF